MYLQVFVVLGSAVIGIFAVIFLFYTNSFLMKRRTRELGLYHILGMGKAAHRTHAVLRRSILRPLESLAVSQSDWCFRNW